MFRNVLVAIDGSPHGAAALTEAIDVVKQNNARMTIMTSVPDPSAWLLSGGPASGGVDYEALAADTESEYRTLLDSAVDQVPAEIPVTKVLAHGRPANRILKQLKEGGHDLVIMGSRGRGEVRSLILGSVSHEVLNASPAAALIVHADPAAGSGTGSEGGSEAGPSEPAS
jgi:nucleotide-binding universal stress UspA family protein